MTDRKQQILETAAELLDSKSFSAFSYQDLADRLGIRKPSIHHHFATKEDLALALIDFYRANGQAAMAAVGAEAETPGQFLSMMLSKSEEILLDNCSVCPAEAFEIDAADSSPELTEALRALKSEHIAQVAELLDAARSGGEVQFLGTSQDQAILMTSAMAGARQGVRLHGREVFRATIRQLTRSMGLTA